MDTRSLHLKGTNTTRTCEQAWFSACVFIAQSYVIYTFTNKCLIHHEKNMQIFADVNIRNLKNQYN